MAVAVRRAPKAIVVSPRMTAYEEASDAIFAILSTVTPLIEPLSLDEAFLDVTASVKLFGAPSQIASDLRARIASEVGLPSSAGIASVKFVAKIASDLAKPNGQKEVAPGEAVHFSPRCPSDACGVSVRKPRPRCQTLDFAPSDRLQLLIPMAPISASPVGVTCGTLHVGIDPAPSCSRPRGENASAPRTPLTRTWPARNAPAYPLCTRGSARGTGVCARPDRRRRGAAQA